MAWYRAMMMVSHPAAAGPGSAIPPSFPGSPATPSAGPPPEALSATAAWRRLQELDRQIEVSMKNQPTAEKKKKKRKN